MRTAIRATLAFSIFALGPVLAFHFVPPIWLALLMGVPFGALGAMYWSWSA